MMARNLFLSSLLALGLLVLPALAQYPTVISVDTAETLGKGGYATRIELLRYERTIPGARQDVVIGDFLQEQQTVDLSADKLLYPVTLTFGVGEVFDLTLGTTVTSGSMEKTIADYYEVGDTFATRTYSQPMFDARIGVKYNLRPDIGDGMPALSVGGEFHTGYTADDEEASGGIFRDKTPADGFPFGAARLYMAGSLKLGPLASVHANVGGYMSQKSFAFSAQAGTSFLMTEHLSLLVGYSTVRLVSGSQFKGMFDFGLAYQVSPNRQFQIALSTVDLEELGLTFGFIVSGEKIPIASPVAEPPSNVEDLF